MGRHFFQGLNALGVPLVSSRIVRVALRGVNPPGCDAVRRSSPFEDRGNPFLPLGGLPIRLIMGQQGPDHPGIFVG